MSEWIKTVEDALAEARDVDDPCCANCTRTALTMLADEVERLRPMEKRAQNLAHIEVDPAQAWQRDVRNAARRILELEG